MKRIVKCVFIPAVALVLLILVGLLALNLYFTECVLPHETTQVSRYPAKLAQWSPMLPTGLFPDPIPANATKVGFSEYPGFMQGGAEMHLVFTLPAEEADKFASPWLARGIYVVPATGDLIDRSHNPSLPEKIDSLRRKYGPLPGFDLIVVSAHDDPDGGFSWNHGHATGLVVNRTTGRIHLWAEAW